MKTFKDLLQSHPKLMVSYISAGTYLVDKTLHSVQSLMKHLLIMQNIDPNSCPGEKFRKALSVAVDNIDKKDFDDDFDFSWSKKCFEKVKNQLSNLNLSKKKYWDLTNVALLDNPKELQVIEPKEGFIKFGDLDDKTQPESVRKKKSNKISKKKIDHKKPIKIKKVSTDFSKRASVETEEKPEPVVIPKKKGVFRRIDI